MENMNSLSSSGSKTDIKKMKTPFAKIIVEGNNKKPLYSILYFDVETNDFTYGYSSYFLDDVFVWLNDCFEIMDEKSFVLINVTLQDNDITGDKIMNIKEWLDKVNTYCKEHEVYSCYDLFDAGINMKFEDDIKSDEHRWFVEVFNVYKINLSDGEHYVGTWEIETLKSEAMSISDCGSNYVLHFVEMEQIPSVSYRVKK